ncbi:MAG: hypothetical protein M1825_002546 [Sarcosagium campestre]|nr:MAG: hypothetical protein M1825_002546 [Sarcosagium campestre]
MADSGLASKYIGDLAQFYSQIKPLIPTYIHLIFTALSAIYAGSHASLSRPLSASKPSKQNDSHGRKDAVNRYANDSDDVDDDDDEDDEEAEMEGFTPTDALWFPLYAGSTLTGLYMLILWLEDPALLSKLLGYFFSIFAFFTVASLISDTSKVIISFVFPKRWGEKDHIWHLVQGEWVYEETSNREDLPDQPHAQIKSPLPGKLSKMNISSRTIETLWIVRSLLTQKLRVRARWRGKLLFRSKVDMPDLLGLLGAAGSLTVYNFMHKSWYLTNFLGPIMLTVATSLDIPAKLLFPRPSSAENPSLSAHAMLGLGDVVLPGMMIGLALRFDLYIYYLRKQVEELTTASNGTLDPERELKVTVTKVTKANYVPASGHWGERFWTSQLLRPAPAHPEGGSFPKTYFYASMAGYVLGLLMTLIVMHVSQHAQPALLYLVPCVLAAVWGMALYMGELQSMWDYTEVDEDEKEDSKERQQVDEKQLSTWGSFLKILHVRSTSTIDNGEVFKKDSASPSKDHTSNEAVPSQDLFSLVVRVAPGERAQQTKKTQ